MAALTNLSDVINRMTGGNSGTPENIFFHKDSRVDAAAAVATIAGRYTSLWQYEGSPAGGAAPGAVAIPTNATDGALKQTDPGGGREKWLLGTAACASVAGTLILYDRLLHISGFSGTTVSPTTQTVGGTLTRNTGGVGNQIWVEIYTQIGASSTTITASYTDQDGNPSQTTTATGIGNTGLREAQRIIPLPLASGDTGVRAVASVTLAATTGTAGDFGVTIARPLAIIPVGFLGVGSIRDNISGIPTGVEIDTDACLALAWLPNSTTAPQVFGSIHMIEA
jgi:hypothetical protein